MKKLIYLFPILLISCKNPDFGSKVHDFAFNESYALVNDLSKKDLDFKWYNYHFNMTSYGLASINKANQTMQDIEIPDLKDIESDTVKLMKVSYILDKHIQTMYEVNEDIYNATVAYQKSLNACSDMEIFRQYTDNRAYLFNSLQMAMPQFDFSYSARVTFSTGSGDSKDDKKDTGIDSIPLIGNIATFFSQKKVKEQKRLFEEAQNYINNIRLDNDELKKTSTASCLNNQAKFKETIEILKTGIEIQKSNFSGLYVSFVKLRDALAPIVIKNIIAQFNSDDLLIYKVNYDTQFTSRIMEMYQTAQLLEQSGEALDAQVLEQVEIKIDTANDLLQELTLLKNSVLGIKNQKLITALETSIKNKRFKLINMTDGRLK